MQFHKELERLITGENIETIFLSDNQLINKQIIRRQSDNQDNLPYLIIGRSLNDSQMAMDITLIKSDNKIMITICMIDNDNDQIIKKK